MSLIHLLALLSALSNAGATILIWRGLRGSNPYTGFWINLTVGTIALWLAVPLSGGAGRISGKGIAFFVLAGLIGTVAGRLLRYVAVEKVGASIAGTLTSLNPLVSTILAILFLGERVTLPILAGTVVIVLGAALLSSGGRRVGFRTRHLALPILSATCFGIVSILRKVGLGETGAVLGSAINVTTAFVAYTAFLLATGQRSAMACRWPSFRWFVAAGLAENGGVFLNVVALGLGTVSVVAPLTGAAPIFVLMLSFVFLRGVEALGPRIVIGTLLTVFGIYLVTALPHR